METPPEGAPSLEVLRDVISDTLEDRCGSWETTAQLIDEAVKHLTFELQDIRARVEQVDKHTWTGASMKNLGGSGKFKGGPRRVSQASPSANLSSLAPRPAPPPTSVLPAPSGEAAASDTLAAAPAEVEC